jgi:hypothetical protein
MCSLGIIELRLPGMTSTSMRRPGGVFQGESRGGKKDKQKDEKQQDVEV